VGLPGARGGGGASAPPPAQPLATWIWVLVVCLSVATLALAAAAFQHGRAAGLRETRIFTETALRVASQTALAAADATRASHASLLRPSCVGVPPDAPMLACDGGPRASRAAAMSAAGVDALAEYVGVPVAALQRQSFGGGLASAPPPPARPPWEHSVHFASTRNSRYGAAYTGEFAGPLDGHQLDSVTGEVIGMPREWAERRATGVVMGLSSAGEDPRRSAAGMRDAWTR
jgi:hypothetical protein